MTMNELLLTAAEEQSNPLLPAAADLFWGSVSFLILLVLFWKYVLPRMHHALGERTQNIEAKLEQAERDRAEADQLLAAYRAQLAEAQAEAARIRTQAQAERKAVVAEARQEAQDAARQVTERALAQLEADRMQARAALARDVGRIAVTLAEKIVGEVLADREQVSASVDRFLDELEAAASDDVARTSAGQR